MTIATSVLVGMSDLLMKLQSPAGRNFETLSLTVVEYFKFEDKKGYKAEDYKVTQLLLMVSFIV